MSLKDTQQPTSTSKSRRSKKHSKKKRTSTERERESRYHRDDESRPRHRKSFSKIFSSLLGSKSKPNAIAVLSDSSSVKKSSNEVNPPSSSPLPEVNSKANGGDEYQYRHGHNNKIPSSRSQLRREPLSGNKIDFLKSVQLSNTNLLQSASKKPKSTRPSGKELIRPDTKTTSLQTFKNDTENVQNAITRKKSKFKKAVEERDILSFFDTGYVTTNSISDGVQINEVQNEDEVNFRSPLSTPQTEEYPPQRPIKLRKEDTDLSNPSNTYVFKAAKFNTPAKPKETNSNVFRFKKPRKTNSRISRSKSTRTARSNSSNPAIWYCKRIPERRKDEEYDDDEDYREEICHERDVLQANPSTFATSPRQRAEELVKKYFPRQLTTQEKKYLTYAIGIILATAGIAAFFLFLSRSKGKTKPNTICERLKVVDECCENEIEDECFPQRNENCWGIDDEDACVYEKHQCVKCQNPNYKAVVSATEKLHEDDDVVCALQDLKKVTKRVKGHKRTCAKRCNGSYPRETTYAAGKCGEYFKGSECTQKCDLRGADCTTQRCEDKCAAARCG